MLWMWVQRMQRIILASGSPKRKELLTKLGVEFEIAESGYDESKIVCDDPVELVEELAIQKALSVAKQYPDAIIIGGDTVVYLAGEIVGKPVDKKDAERIIRLLSGTTHMVVTGVAVVNSLTGDQLAGHEEGWVRFRELTEAEINKYVESGVWRGFAGGYAIQACLRRQGAAVPFVTEQTGSLSAVVGFPVTLVVSLLEQMGIGVEVDPVEVELNLHGMKIGLEK